MKNMKFNIIKFVVLLFLVSSCNDVLDETPDNRTTINSAEKVAELLVGAYPEASYVSFLEPMSDNADDKGPSATTEYRVNQYMYNWEDLDDITEDTPTNYWNKAYKAIAQANQALASIEELGGGPELNSLKGEALLCRAYGHYMLVNIFSKAYNPSTSGNDLGIPYVTEPETVLIGEYERGNVLSVYENIQKDLEAGLPLIKDAYDVPAFHFTKKAAGAFASRFYITTAQWQKAIDQSNIALGNDVIGVLRYTLGYRSLTTPQQAALYTSSTLEPANLLLVSGYSLYNRIDARARYQLSPNIVEKIFRTNITGRSWAYPLYTRGGGSNYLVIKFAEYFRYTNQAAGIGQPFVTFVLFSTDEALLNRAEAYAMLGQYSKATNDINTILSLKTLAYNPATDTLTPNDIEDEYVDLETDQYTPFYTVTAETLPYVKAVLDIKRTVLYNEGMRWFDIKRFNMALEHLDDKGNSALLPKDDNRRAIQIPVAAQSFGIQKNPR